MASNAGLATISHTESIRQFEYTALSPGLYTIVVGDVTVLIDAAGDSVDVSAAITGHEDVDIDWVTGGVIHCNPTRFKKLREDLDND